MRPRQLGLLCGTGLLALLTPACSKAYDAYFANPCPHPVEIVTYLVPPSDVPDERSSRRVIPPNQLVKSVGAFAGSNPDWTVEIISTGELIGVSASDFEDDDDVESKTIVIPASACKTADG